jgi:hypothetical protein
MLAECYVNSSRAEYHDSRFKNSIVLLDWWYSYLLVRGPKLAIPPINEFYQLGIQEICYNAARIFG